jgi:hypothetical protein
MSGQLPIGGTAVVRFNGNVMKFVGDMTHNFQEFKKKKKAGRDGTIHGFTVEPSVPMIKGKFTHDGTYTTADYEAIVDALVTATLGDGRVLTLRGAVVSGDIEINVDEAEVELTFEGDAGEELPAPGGA